MSSDANPRSPLENVVFGVSLVLVLALVAALVYRAVTGPSGPPNLRVSMEAQGTRVQLSVENTGGSVAEDVSLTVCDAGGTCAGVTLPYVPAGAVRRAAVQFAAAPRPPLVAESVTYRTP